MAGSLIFFNPRKWMAISPVNSPRFLEPHHLQGIRPHDGIGSKVPIGTDVPQSLSSYCQMCQLLVFTVTSRGLTLAPSGSPFSVGNSCPNARSAGRPRCPLRGKRMCESSEERLGAPAILAVPLASHGHERNWNYCGGTGN
jgi:hypothetical protein